MIVGIYLRMIMGMFAVVVTVAVRMCVALLGFSRFIAMTMSSMTMTSMTMTVIVKKEETKDIRC